MKTKAITITLVILGLCLCGLGIYENIQAKHAKELRWVHQQAHLAAMQQNIAAIETGLGNMQANTDRLKEIGGKIQALADAERAVAEQQAAAERQRQRDLYEAGIRRQQAEMIAEQEKRLGFVKE